MKKTISYIMIANIFQMVLFAQAVNGLGVTRLVFSVLFICVSVFMLKTVAQVFSDLNTIKLGGSNISVINGVVFLVTFSILGSFLSQKNVVAQLTEGSGVDLFVLILICGSAISFVMQIVLDGLHVSNDGLSKN